MLRVLCFPAFGLLGAAPGYSAQQQIEPLRAQLRFSDCTEQAGLKFDLATAPDHHGKLFPGTGTVGDFNRDGWPDLYVPSTGVDPDRLFINQQDGSFREEAAAWGIARVHRGCGATVGDYDDNGYPDVFVTSTGDPALHWLPALGQHLLYRNNGDGSFSEVAAAAGVNRAGRFPDGMGAAFGDPDQDGDLDLYTTSWHASSEGNRLFRNNGNGTFSDQTVAAGVFEARMRAFAPRFADLNRDLRLDLLMAADIGTTRLYQNLGGGLFGNVTHLLRPDRVHNGMGHAVADFNGDGWLDWFVTSIYWDQPFSWPNGNRLYLARPDLGVAEALPEQAGVNDGGWGWGTEAADFDHDGDVDLVETNGYYYPEFTGEQSYLWLNDGDGRSFTESALEVGLDYPEDGRGLVCLDYDRDGDLDVALFAHNGPVKLFRNDLTGPGANWLRVALDTQNHPGLAPDGYGSRIEIRYQVGGRRKEVVGYVDGGCTYLGNSEPAAHFGLGLAESIQEMRVLWANGQITVLSKIPINQILTLAPPLPH